MNTNVTAHSDLDHIRTLLYPEQLEDSKVIAFLSDNLAFKISEFATIKEVKKLAPETADLVNLLKQINFVTVDETSETCTIILNESFTMYSLLNIPANITKPSELQQLLKIEECDRLYKKNFSVWYLVSTNPSKAESISSALKNAHFGDEKLKYDVYTFQMIKKNLLKRIQNFAYHKETSELKSNHSTATSGETGSWRKKSNDSEEIGFRKGSKNVEKQEKPVSHFEQPSSFKRKRFNSDAGDDNPRNNQPETKAPIKTVPNELIKYRYNLKQIFDVFEHTSQVLQKEPNFIHYIEDICSKEKRNNLNILSPKESPEKFKRDRSNTFHILEGGFKFSLNESSKINLPKNNHFDNIVI